MRLKNRLAFLVPLLFAFAGLLANGSALADPPVRAARLAYISGSVSFSPAGEGQWYQAVINRPLTIGDRLWADGGARVEIQIGGAMLRMGENTSLVLLNLDGNVAQVRLEEGTLNLRARRFAPRQYVEIATPNLAFTVRQPGSYRIEVDASGDATAVVVRSGRGEVYGERASYYVDSRQSYRFGGTGLRSYEYITARFDAFDTWSAERDRRLEASISARYVSADVVGYEELDAHGTWRSVPEYGRVWVPTRVSSDWTPYRDGHWVWVAPWGWTWVDDAPWGYAVSHYGRWASVRGTWCWVPAPVQARAVYAPALVAFIGGPNFQISLSTGGSGVAWFPLGPREVYRPWYPASRGYFETVNRSNTNVSNTTIVNVYNNVNVNNVYVNRQVQNAVVAVPAATFTQSQPVRKAAVQPAPQAAASAPVATAAPAAPAQGSARSAAPAASVQPPARVHERPVIVRSAPPPAAAPASTAQAPATGAAKPAAPAPAANVKVVEPAQAKAPTAPPPAAAPEGKPAATAERKADDRKGESKAPAAAAAPSAPAPAAPPPAAAQKATQPAPSAERKAEERKGGERRAEERKSEERKAPAAAAAPSAPTATPAPAVPPPAAAQKATPATPPQAATPATPATPPPAAQAREGRPGADRERPADRRGDQPQERRAEDRRPPAAATGPSAPPSGAAQKSAPPQAAVPSAPPPKPAPTTTPPAPAKAEPGPAAKAAPDAGKAAEARKAERKRDDRKRGDDDKKDENK